MKTGPLAVKLEARLLHSWVAFGQVHVILQTRVDKGAWSLPDLSSTPADDLMGRPEAA